MGAHEVGTLAALKAVPIRGAAPPRSIGSPNIWRDGEKLWRTSAIHEGIADESDLFH